MPNLSSDRLASAIINGLQSVTWPGRLECISFRPKVLIDIAHSPDACTRIAQTISEHFKDKRILLVTGVSANKAVEKNVEALVPLAQKVICTRAYHKGEQVPTIARHVRRFAPGIEVVECETVERAAQEARTAAISSNMTVLVTGSLFLAIEFKAAWQGNDPKTLRFL